MLVENLYMHMQTDLFDLNFPEIYLFWYTLSRRTSSRGYLSVVEQFEAQTSGWIL